MKYFKKTIALAITATLLIAGSGLTKPEIQTKEAKMPPKEKEAPAPQEAEAAETLTVKSCREPVSRGEKRPGPIPREEIENTQVGEEKKQEARIYNIPLAEDLQEYTFTLCQEHGIDYEIVLALMDQESSYRPNLISKTNDYGLMQINKVNHEWLKRELEIKDFLDPQESIQAGTRMLGDLFKKYEDPHKALMAYNFGEGGAKKHWKQGTYSSKYSRSVMAKADKLKEVKEDDE